MTMRPGDASSPATPPSTGAAPGRPFQLTRYFTATSLLAFVVLGIALYFLERSEQQFFASAQGEQNAFFAQVQAQLLREHKETARANLVKVHEAGHVALTHVFANALWSPHFAPLVAAAQAVPPAPCRGAAGDAQQACRASLRARLVALPGFTAADAAARALMRTTSVFKVKVYDVRGLTVYSSELAQIGEDKSDNAGWLAAASGRVASELVHRNRFSAFEGEVEDRDLIQSYVPVPGPGAGHAGVLEIYSDVTPLLLQIDAAAARIADANARNEARVQEATARNQRMVQAASTKLLLIVAALLALTYAALLFLVRNGQRIIDAESRVREQAALREQQWHRDKMATMAAMAANISHEVGNPLAIISGLAQDMAQWREAADIDPGSARLIVEQTARIAGMTRRITDFATAGPEGAAPFDVNQVVRSLCEFLAFDRRFVGTPIELRLGERLPACHGVPDHLTEVLMGLLQALEEVSGSCRETRKRIVVQTLGNDGGVVLRLACECPAGTPGCRLPAGDSRLESARRRMEAMGARIDDTPMALEIHLACVLTDAAPAPPPMP